MADQTPLSGEWCTLVIDTDPVAASRTFTMNVDSASYGNFVARSTSKWRTNYPADIGGTMDIDGLVVTADTNPASAQFDDLFTFLNDGTEITVLFTLTSQTAGETTFIYSCSAVLTSLSASTPQFGEATYSCSLILSGTLSQSTGTVVMEIRVIDALTLGDTASAAVV